MPEEGMNIMRISAQPKKGYVPCRPKIGDSIRIVRPDPDSGCSCIVGQFDCAWEVMVVRENGQGHLVVTIRTDWVPMFKEVFDLIQCPDMDWIEIVQEKPWRPKAKEVTENG